MRLDEETYFRVLHPDKSFAAVESPLNNNSLVLKLYYKNISLLLAGDIENEAERYLLSCKEELESDVVKVAHHGSATSSGEDFLNAVAPKAAVISVGKNGFGHPSPDTLERIAKKGIHIFRTDENGAVIMRSDGNTIKFQKTVGEQ